jgi:hypothetical protein
MQDSNNNMKSVHTAVCVEQQDLEEPLLLVKSSSQEQTTNDTITTSNLNATFRLHGLVVGFLAQITNVSGTTYLYSRWGTTNSHELDWQEWLLRTCIWSISQVDLCLYVFMWLSFLTVELTRKGMQITWLNLPKGNICILGVQFYIGVVVGVFCVWAAVDIVLSLYVPLLPMVGVVIYGCTLSYAMEQDDDDNDDEEEEEICSII